MNNDLTTLTHTELTALLATLSNERAEAVANGQTMRVVNIDHEMSQVRAQLQKVKPAKVDNVKQDEQPKLF